MTPHRPFDRDVRTDAECRYNRAGIDAAPNIDAFGLAVDAGTVCQPDVDLELARFPHRECGADPALWPGAAVVGTREPQYDGDVVREGGGIEAMTGPGLPRNRAEIAARLIGESGFGHAPIAFLSLSGWLNDYAVDFADRLLGNGLEANAIISERVMAASVRQIWIAVFVNGCSTIADSGAVRVVRSLLDATAAMMAAIDAEISTTKPAPAGAHDERANLAGLLVCRLDAVLWRLDKMCDGLGGKSAMHLTKLIADARHLADAIGRFTVLGGTAIARCKIVGGLLASKNCRHEKTRLADKLDGLNARLAALETGSSTPAWPERYRRGLMDNLANTDRSTRAAGLDAVRGDRLYALIMSRRLNHVYCIAPWMCAPSASFPLVFGGPSGGIAQLTEAARAMEIGHEQKRRLFDVGDPNRLDAGKCRAAFRTAASVQAEVGACRRAGFLLAMTAMSHHMVTAYKDDFHFDERHPIPVVLGGGLGYDFSASVTDPRTSETIATIELRQPIYSTADYDRDVPRYMDMTLVQMLACAVAEIFDASFRGPWFARQRQIAFGKGKFAALPVSVSTRDLVRSMLLSIDDAASAVHIVPRPAGTTTTIETDRFDSLISGRLGSVYHEETAQGLRRDASRRAADRGPRADALRRLTDRARVWTPASKGGTIDEESLARILDGCNELPGSLPVSHVFYSVLSFRPDIDCEILTWVAQGCRIDAAPAGTSDLTAESARIKVAELEAQSQGRRLGATDNIARHVRTLIPVFTGLSATTADPAHHQRLTCLASKHAAKVRIVDGNERTNDDVAATARRDGAQDQDEGLDGRSRDRSDFVVQSALPGAARPGANFGAGSRIEGGRTDQRRSRRRSR